MPGRNRTGPIGQGPMTGRGLGPCARGRRFGRDAMTKEEEREMLLKEKEAIEKRLEELN